MIDINDYEIGLIFQEIELQLIRSLKRNLKGHTEWETAEGFKWDAWQAKKLMEIQKFRQQNKAIMNGYQSKIDKATKSDLRVQFLEGGKKVDKEFSNVVSKGMSLKRSNPSKEFFTGNNEKLDNLVKAVHGDMSNAQHAALRHMDDVYRKTIFKSELFLGSGATTIDKAIDMATKDFLSKGINCIRYADGRNVNIASYARMAVRTANKRVHLMGEGERRKEWGISTVQISQYALCSPLCLPWQGHVFIDDVYSGGSQEDAPYPLLSTAIAGHLFHPNCKHTSSTFFPDISTEPYLMYGESDDEYNNARREAEVNHNIQKYKRLKEGSLDPQNVKKYDYKVKEWENIAKSLDNPSGSDIIKNITLDDFNDVAYGKNIDETIINEIYSVIQAGEKLGDFYINDIKVRSIASEFGNVLMQIEPYPSGKIASSRLIINSDVVSGVTLEELNNRIEKTSFNVARNLKEATVHETGHAKLIYKKSLNEITDLYSELEELGIEGISKIAENDGVECLAEIEVLLHRGDEVPEEAIKLYNKYMKG